MIFFGISQLFSGQNDWHQARSITTIIQRPDLHLSNPTGVHRASGVLTTSSVKMSTAKRITCYFLSNQVLRGALPIPPPLLYPVQDPVSTFPDLPRHLSPLIHSVTPDYILSSVSLQTFHGSCHSKIAWVPKGGGTSVLFCIRMFPCMLSGIQWACDKHWVETSWNFFAEESERERVGEGLWWWGPITSSITAGKNLLSFSTAGVKYAEIPIESPLWFLHSRVTCLLLFPRKPRLSLHIPEVLLVSPPRFFSFLSLKMFNFLTDTVPWVLFSFKSCISYSWRGVFPHKARTARQHQFNQASFQGQGISRLPEPLCWGLCSVVWCYGGDSEVTWQNCSKWQMWHLQQSPPHSVGILSVRMLLCPHWHWIIPVSQTAHRLYLVYRPTSQSGN